MTIHVFALLLPGTILLIFLETHQTRWNKVVNSLRDDPRFLAVGPCDDEKQAIFDRHIDDLQVH